MLLYYNISTIYSLFISYFRKTYFTLSYSLTNLYLLVLYDFVPPRLSPPRWLSFHPFNVQYSTVQMLMNNNKIALKHHKLQQQHTAKRRSREVGVEEEVAEEVGVDGVVVVMEGEFF